MGSFYLVVIYLEGDDAKKICVYFFTNNIFKKVLRNLWCEIFIIRNSSLIGIFLFYRYSGGCNDRNAATSS